LVVALVLFTLAFQPVPVEMKIMNHHLKITKAKVLQINGGADVIYLTVVRYYHEAGPIDTNGDLWDKDLPSSMPNVSSQPPTLKFEAAAGTGPQYVRDVFSIEAEVIKC